MTNTTPAGFLLRLLASITDAVIAILVVVLGFYLLSTNLNLENVGLNLMLYLSLVFLPILIFSFLVSSLMVYYFGATFGKLLTGIKVVGVDKKLTFKEVLFRQTVGYQFSSLIFGLGFWSIIKDQDKRGWHDKAIGSKVIVERLIWPLALFGLILSLGLTGYFSALSVKNISQSPVISDFSTLFEEMQNVEDLDIAPTEEATDSVEEFEYNFNEPF